MTPEQIDNLDMWGDWEPVVIEESETPDFSKPIKGKYGAEITGLEYKEVKSTTTEETFELISMKMKVTKDIEGDPSFKRLLDKAYFMGVSQFNDDPIAGYKRLLTDLNSSGLYADWMKTQGGIKDAVAKIAENVVGKTVFITAFPKKDKQQIRIVKPKEATATSSSPKSKFEV